MSSLLEFSSFSGFRNFRIRPIRLIFLQVPKLNEKIKSIFKIFAAYVAKARNSLFVSFFKCFTKNLPNSKMEPGMRKVGLYRRRRGHDEGISRELLSARDLANLNRDHEKELDYAAINPFLLCFSRFFRYGRILRHSFYHQKSSTSTNFIPE